MIRHLSISNYALIDTLELDLDEGLTILTGETGAGKSVMMGALSLLMGERADSKVLAGRDGKSVVEGTFDNVTETLRPAFESNDLDWNDGEVIIRREISSGGRSRAFINDTPVTLPLLTEIAGGMVDIHSQHSNRLLSRPDQQLKIIDSLADDGRLLADYKNDFSEFASLRSEIMKLRAEMEKNRENRLFRAFQLEQLAKLNPKPGELAEVEKTYDILSDADDLRSKISTAAFNISAGERSVLTLITDALNQIGGIDFSIFGIDTEDDSLPDRLRNLYIELKDIGDTLEKTASEIESDPARLARADARLKDLYDAVKRFKVKDYDELMALYTSLRDEQNGGGESLQRLNELESRAKAIGERLKTKAEKLSSVRAAAAEKFSRRLTQEAKPLGLKNLRFEVRISQGRLTHDGRDTVEFYCAFNKNQNPMPLAQTASGGEMARLTLCIKAIIADKMKLPTVIFDEIDTGVSGDIADRMGSLMADIASGMQVLAITHLPQVAAKGSKHLLVFKQDSKERTVSHVRVLDSEGRVRELARMLSGREINEAALANARALLGERT